MALPVVVAVGDETADRLIERLKPLIACARIIDGRAARQDENEMGRLFHVLINRKCWVTSTKELARGATLVMDSRNYSVAGIS